MKSAFITILILTAGLANPALAKGPKLEKLPFFEGGGNGFGGFGPEGNKPGKGIPGGFITSNRSPTAIAVLTTIFSAVSTTGGTD